MDILKYLILKLHFLKFCVLFWPLEASCADKRKSWNKMKQNGDEKSEIIEILFPWR